MFNPNSIDSNAVFKFYLKIISNLFI